MIIEALKRLNLVTIVTVFVLVVAGCSPGTQQSPARAEADGWRQAPEALVAGEVMAIAYSGFREGQHPDRGDGAVNPSREEILEDLQILLAHDFKLIRLYDAKENSQTTLELIDEHDLPIKVLLGIGLSLAG